MVNDYLATAEAIVAQYGYLILFLGMVLENAMLLGVLVPGVTLVILGGYYAGTGHLNLFGALLAVFLGVCLGDNLSYLLGRRGIAKIPGVKHWASRLQKREQAIINFSGPLILFFHFSAYARLIVPALAGMVNYETKRWLILDTLGALLFSVAFLAIGYAIGRSSLDLQIAFSASRSLQLSFVFAFLLGVAYFWIATKRFLRRKYSHHR